MNLTIETLNGPETVQLSLSDDGETLLIGLSRGPILQAVGVDTSDFFAAINAFRKMVEKKHGPFKVNGKTKVTSMENASDAPVLDVEIS